MKEINAKFIDGERASTYQLLALVNFSNVNMQLDAVDRSPYTRSLSVTFLVSFNLAMGDWFAIYSDP
jgi:hypothetical protein